MKSSIKFVLLGVALMFSLPAFALNDVDGFDHVDTNLVAAIDQAPEKLMRIDLQVNQLVGRSFTASTCNEHPVKTQNCHEVAPLESVSFLDQPEKVPIN